MFLDEQCSLTSNYLVNEDYRRIYYVPQTCYCHKKSIALHIWNENNNVKWLTML